MFFQYNRIQLSQNPHSQELDDAPDKPPTAFITILIVLCFLLIFFLIAFAFPMTAKLVNYQESKSSLGMGNETRMNYLETENKILSSYKKIDNNHYQIPIDQAMKQVVATQGDIFQE